MIKLKQTNDPQQLEVTLSGEVSASDYEEVLTPGIVEALQDNDCIRLLVIVEDDVSYEFGAAWSDLRLGLSHWRGFDRIAVVTELNWVASTVGVVAPFAPCPMQVFQRVELEDARRWLRESLGTMHIQKLDNGVLHIQLLGKLEPAIYETKNEEFNDSLIGLNEFKLLLDLREFDGWEGLSALFAHLNFVREHVARLQKIAIVGNSAWQKMAERIGKRILGLEACFFDKERFDDAKAWLQ